jgi:hypothetical protein
LAPDAGLEASDDKGFVISRRKTSRAVIARTMIDGTTHMTQSPTASQRRLSELLSFGLCPTCAT